MLVPYKEVAWGNYLVLTALLGFFTPRACPEFAEGALRMTYLYSSLLGEFLDIQQWPRIRSACKGDRPVAPTLFNPEPLNSTQALP
jgi:hypothetical protein